MTGDVVEGRGGERHTPHSSFWRSRYSRNNEIGGGNESCSRTRSRTRRVGESVVEQKASKLHECIAAGC